MKVYYFKCRLDAQTTVQIISSTKEDARYRLNYHVKEAWSWTLEKEEILK